MRPVLTSEFLFQSQRLLQSMFFTSFIIQHSWRLFSIHSPDLIGSPNSSWLFWYYSQLVPCLLHNTLEAGVLNGVPFSSPFQNILELYKCCQSVIWLSSPKQKQTNIFFHLFLRQCFQTEISAKKFTSGVEVSKVIRYEIVIQLATTWEYLPWIRCLAPPASFNLHNNFIASVLLPLFYRWENWSWGRSICHVFQHSINKYLQANSISKALCIWREYEV